MRKMFSNRSGLRYGLYFIAVIITAGLLAGCASLDKIGIKPTASFEGVGLSDASLLESTINFKFLINNPNLLSLRTGLIRYELKLNGNDFARGQLNQGISLPPASMAPLTIPVKIRYLDFFPTLAEMIRSQKIAYMLSGSFAMGSLELPLAAGGTIDMPRPPSITVASLAVNRMSLSGAEMTCRLKVDNPNAFDMKFNRIFYNLKLNGMSLGQMDVRPLVVVGPNSTGTIETPIKISFALTGHAVYELLQKQETQYRMEAQMVFDSPSGGIESIPFVATGSIPVLR